MLEKMHVRVQNPDKYDKNTDLSTLSSPHDFLRHLTESILQKLKADGICTQVSVSNNGIYT